MSKEPTSIPPLEPPIKIQDALKDQRNDFDCLPCRLMGSAAFAGLGIYSYASGMKQLREREYEILKSGSKFGMRSRRAGIYVISGMLVGLGVYRLQN